MTHPNGSFGVVLAAAALTVAAWSGGANAQDTAAPANAAKGKQLFIAHGCYGCHGFNGETGARDLVGTNSPILADEALFTMFLRQRADQAPALPSTRMPNYPVAALGATEVRDLYAYIRTFSLNAPAADKVPALRAIIEAAAKPYKP